MLTGLVAAGIVASQEVRAEDFVLQTGSPAPGMFNILNYIGKEVGYFKEEDLNVEVRHSTSSSQAAQISASGGADVGSIGLDSLLQGYEKGMRGKFFFQHSRRLIYYMAVMADSPIRQATDLRGKKVGVSNMGSASIIFARATLREAKIDPVEGTFVPVGLGNSAITALRNGKVDALSLWDSAYATMESAGNKLHYIRYSQAPTMGFGGYFTSENVLKTKRPTLVKYSRAIAKSMIFAQENPEATLRILWKTVPAVKIGADDADAMKKGLIELESAKATFGLGKDFTSGYGLIDPPSLVHFADLMKAEGVVKTLPPVADIIDPSIAVEANNFDVAAVRAAARAAR